MIFYYKNNGLSLPALPVASATVAGVIKVGANLSISEDGVLSSSAGSGGETTIAGGNGITIEHNEETKIDTISLSTDTQTELSKISSKADKTALDELASTVDTKADASALESLRVEVNGKATQESVNALSTKIGQKVNKSGDTMTGDLNLEAKLNIGTSDITIEDDAGKLSIGHYIDGVKNYVELSGIATPSSDYSSANKKYVDDRTSTIESGLDDKASKEEVNTIHKTIATIQTNLDGKVSKTGDEMTGRLIAPSIASGDIVLTGLFSEPNYELSLEALNGEGGELIRLKNVNTPQDNTDAVNKQYTDTIKTTADEALTKAEQCLTLIGQVNAKLAEITGE